jgi:hypothetical protein
MNLQPKPTSKYEGGSGMKKKALVAADEAVEWASERKANFRFAPNVHAMGSSRQLPLSRAQGELFVRRYSITPASMRGSITWSRTRE